MTPRAGVAAATRARNRASRSVRKPGAFRTRSQASSQAAGKSEGSGISLARRWARLVGKALVAVAFERRRQVGGDIGRGPSLDVLSLEHEHELPVLEESDLGRRRR